LIAAPSSTTGYVRSAAVPNSLPGWPNTGTSSPALYETWAQEMRLHGQATTRRWVTLPSVELRAWGVVAQLAAEGREQT